MRKRVSLLLILSLFSVGRVLAEEAPAFAFPLLEEKIRFQLPEEWITLVPGEGAAERGVMCSVASPEGDISLQVIHMPDCALADTFAMLDGLNHVSGLREHEGDPLPYLSYQIDNLHCYVVQVAEDEAIGLYFTLTSSDHSDQAEEIAQEIIASITFSQ